MVNYISSLPDSSFNASFPRSVALMGSTGSIGTNALAVIEEQPELFHVTALAGARNMTLLAEQATKHRPQFLATLDEKSAKELKTLLPSDYSPKILTGPDGYAEMASLSEVSVVLSAQVGAAGLRATFAAARAGKVIALANKESLVLAGDLIRPLCEQTGAVLLPVDSEHNAIFQALRGHNHSEVRRIILTASGGPFRGKDKQFLSTVTREQALNHPNWSMGAKISIDSATLMNKGLEVIEAYHLYGVPLETIEVVVHPQSIVHSLVEYNDGSQLAHLGPPDMRIAIAYCMGWPKVLKTGVKPLDLIECGPLTFEKPDISCFPCLRLAKEALRQDNGLPVVLNAANEIAVELFLKNKLAFMDIPSLIELTMETHTGTTPSTIEEIEALDAETRVRSHELGRQFTKYNN